MPLVYDGFDYEAKVDVNGKLKIWKDTVDLRHSC